MHAINKLQTQTGLDFSWPEEKSNMSATLPFIYCWTEDCTVRK